jgi:hypothetical protein
VLTFAGFIMVVEIIVLLGIYDYNGFGPIRDGVQVIPNWVLVACGVLLFTAYNLGNYC